MKVPNLLFCILLIIGVDTNSSFSQSIQELEQKLKASTTAERPVILNHLAEAYLRSDVPTSIDYAGQALKASRKLRDLESETTALLHLGDAYDALKNQKKSFQYYLEAIKLFEQNNQPSSAAYTWNKIADIYLSKNQYPEAIDANSKALTLFKKANNNTGILNINIELGDINFNQQKYQSSLPNYKEALKMYEDSKDVKGQVTILNRIGTAYSQWDDYDEAYIFYSRGLDIANKNNLIAQANAISQNLEFVKKNMSNWQKSQTEYALQQQERSLEQERQIKTKESTINRLTYKNIKSIREIEQLSEDAQLKELRIKAQQEENNRILMDAEAQLKANEFLKKEKEFTESKLNTQRIIIWGGVAFSALGILLTVITFSAYRNKKKANDIQKQKNEIIYKQKDLLQQKNILITDSIDYAKSIQDAILPSADVLSNYFAESYIFYKPKDIVSGDFYWIQKGKSADSICVAAADCTGHGVPGAFMSLLGFILLNDRWAKSASPADLLKELNTQLVSLLQQNSKTAIGKFGMDIALIEYDKQKKELVFAGAHHPLIVVKSNGEFIEIKGDRAYIGTSKDCSFVNHTVEVKTGDIIYLYSDGYQDQMGGEKKTKFFANNFKALLKEIHLFSPEKQMEELNKKHIQWKKTIDQTDDILIIGLKV